MKQEAAAAYTEKCFNGEPAPCGVTCPFQLDIRSFLEKAGKGRWNAAYKSLRSAVLFPAIVSELCKSPCESDCLRTQTGDEPIAVRMIEDACVRLAKKKSPDRYAIPPKNEQIAVVGAGIAGLSAALCLAQKNYPVTVFDKNSTWGGSLRTHPRFDEFNDEIALQFSAVNAEFRFDTEILSLDELAGHDLIYIATGTGGDDFGLLPGWDPKLFTTDRSKVFMGGALTGTQPVDAIAQGKALSKTAEVFLQTGKVSESLGGGENIACRIDCTGAVSSPRIASTGSDGYTEDEAKSEAARCFICDCDMCMAACEMLNAFRKKPKKIAMEVYTDTKVTPPYSTHTITRQAYSCNMCGYCKTICPNDVDIGTLLQTSRAARVGSETYPAAFHDYWLAEMDFSTSDASLFAPPSGSSGYIFYPGCQLGMNNPEYVYKSYDFLKSNYNAGLLISCCGAPAYWAGDTERQNANFESMRNALREIESPKIVYACATCESIFKLFLPEIPCVSLYELLAKSEKISPVRFFDAASVFDPCNARSNPEMEFAVRELVGKSGAELYELPEKNRCCGYGGHIRVANPALYDKITENRAGMGENPYIVYCVNCSEVFLTRGKECTHILDIAFDIPRSADVPRIDKKRENAMQVKRKLSKELIGMDIAEKEREWDSLELIIGEELSAEIERKLIRLSDIKEAIWLAEKADDKFIDEKNGICQCSMEKSTLTYWVQYKKAGDGIFEVNGAYFHRMRIGGEA